MSQEYQEMETDEFQLVNCPDEILLKIFCNLSNHSLLQAIRVCKRFEMIAEASFSKKYSGASEDNFYKLTISGANFTDERKQFQSIFCNFGKAMRAIKIDFMNESVARNHWLPTLIRRHCTSTKKLSIAQASQVDLSDIVCFLPNLTHLSLERIEFLNQKWTQYTFPKLIHFSVDRQMHEADLNAIITFIDRNPQMEHLYLYSIEKSYEFLYAVNGKLNNVKTLGLSCKKAKKANIMDKSSILRMDSLKTLTVGIDQNSFVPLLTSIREGIKTIEELTVSYVGYYHELNVEEVKLLCSFDMLKTLELTVSWQLSFDLLKLLIINLPNLVSFSLADAYNLCGTHDEILNVVTTCQKLSLLRLTIHSDLPVVDYSFCTRFADIVEVNGTKLKLELYSEPDKMIFTVDEARLIKYCDDENENKEHSILYWKGYDVTLSLSNKNLLQLNEEILKKIFTFLDGKALSACYQTCVRAKQLALECIAENGFYCAVTPPKCTSEDTFMVLGEHIQRITVNLTHDTYDSDDDEDIEGTESHKLKTTFIKWVNQYCGKSLVDMEIESTVQNKTIFYCPQLRKLKLACISTQKLQLFRCPELRHLDIYYFEEEVTVSIDWRQSFPNLTSLTIGSYNSTVEQFLSGLNASICSQINYLSLSGKWETGGRLRSDWLKLTNIIVRFGRLVTLHLRIKGIEKSNFKFLFENCSMLTELIIFSDSRFYNSDVLFVKLFRTIKQNCMQMEVIGLVGNTSLFSLASLHQIYSMFPKLKFIK